MAAKRLLIAVALIGAALFLALSLVSYDGEGDSSGALSNMGGSVGGWIAHYLIMAFGLGSFAISFFLVFVGYRLLDDEKFKSPAIKCVGALLFSLTVAMGLQVVHPHASYSGSSYPLGGILGETFSAELSQLFGGFGTFLLLLLLGASSLVLATDTFFLKALASIPQTVSRAVARARPPAFLKLKAAMASAPHAGTTSPDKILDIESPEETGEIPGIEDDVEWIQEKEELTGLDEDKEEEPPAPRPELVIRTSIRPTGDDVEILKLERAKHLEGKDMYALPPLTLLDDPILIDNQDRDNEIRMKAYKLEETLKTFDIDAKVVEITRGPSITVYELELAAGTKVKKVTALPDDISMALKAKTIRIVAPIPGKSTVGIEVPNDTQEPVMIKELAICEELRTKNYKIPMLLGKDAAGAPLVEDLTDMPHMLIAGQTGSGKSVCLNSIIVSVLMTKYPEEVRFILVDPKMVELHAFRNIPHLLTPVVTDMKKAPKVLEWVVGEMDRRYELLRATGVRNIDGFNDLGEEEAKSRLSEHFDDDELEHLDTHLPYVILVVDELADLMLVSAKEVETSICRLAQKARAVGLHVILATQRPSVDVITGLIKANMPSRISFRVASKVDSRTILDGSGADRLLGRGDMLFIPSGAPAPTRCQAAYVQDHEIKNITKYIKEVAQPEYNQELQQVRASSSTSTDGGPSNEGRDPLYHDAIRAVLMSGRGSVSMLQRKLEIGYTRAARLVDFMAEDGIVGEFKGSKAREVLTTLEEWEELVESQDT